MGDLQHEYQYDARHDVTMAATAGARRPFWRTLFSLLGLLAFAAFIALGNWQLERRAWKLDLIERVNARVNEPAVAAPSPAEWPDLSRDTSEYRHISLEGQFLPQLDTLVVAVSEQGSGYWVLTPLQTRAHGTVLINRGFVGQGVTPAAVPEGTVRISGLLRLSEPGGGFLRSNAPETERWYSRDVDAIANSLELELAPYFVDADAGSPGSPGGAGPVGGLTVVQFYNSHLVYALTWYTLAAMVVVAGIILTRESGRQS